MRKKWGSYKVLGKGKDWKVKLLTLNPGRRTSVQKHKLRWEIWIFFGGIVRIIKKNEWHQLLNTSNKKVQIIEVQLGKCLERDIVREGDKNENIKNNKI